MANVHGSPGAPLQTRPDIERGPWVGEPQRIIGNCHVTRYTRSVIKTFADRRTEELRTSSLITGSRAPDWRRRSACRWPSVNDLLRSRRALSPEMLLRLSPLFGNSAEFWLNGQRAVDLWDAAEALRDAVSLIKPLRVA
jgi:hypothetical protein